MPIELVRFASAFCISSLVWKQCMAMFSFGHFLVVLSLLRVGFAASNSSSGIDGLAAQALGKLQEYSAPVGNLSSSNKCTLATAAKRRDWYVDIVSVNMTIVRSYKKVGIISPRRKGGHTLMLFSALQISLQSLL
jgi:hypothetical protein